jgi:hypothetical protein
VGDESQCGTALQGATRHQKRECKLVGEHNPARRFRVWDTPHFETTLRPCIQLRLDARLQAVQPPGYCAGGTCSSRRLRMAASIASSIW